jgi:hypothetical protein
VVAATAVRSGSTLGLRIEQSGAQLGDAFSTDDVALRIPARAFGAETPGTLWTTMANDVSRVSVYSAPGPDGQPDSFDRFLDRCASTSTGAVGRRAPRSCVRSSTPATAGCRA